MRQIREFITDGQTSCNDKKRGRERIQDRIMLSARMLAIDRSRTTATASMRNEDSPCEMARNAKSGVTRASSAADVLIYVERHRQTKPIRARITRRSISFALGRRGSRRRMLKPLICAKVTLCAKTGRGRERRERGEKKEGIARRIWSGRRRQGRALGASYKAGILVGVFAV